MEKLLGGKLFRAKSLTELAAVEHDYYMDRQGGLNHTQFQRSSCQCCGFREKPNSIETCVCDGTDWYQLPDGRVECQPHRIARAIKGERKWWDFRR